MDGDGRKNPPKSRTDLELEMESIAGMKAWIAETAELCLNVVLGAVASAPATRAPLVAWSFRMAEFQGARGNAARAILGLPANDLEHRPRADETPLDRLFGLQQEVDELCLFVAEALGAVRSELPMPMQEFLAAAYPAGTTEIGHSLGDIAVRYHEIIREDFP